ncbi:MAG: SdrD B-like domain-containing protein [Candidatus Daviesbacteria bacterium]|nr:SdrD B-like domain-containing protein [Candidatus Daviesbacteria bacterium]
MYQKGFIPPIVIILLAVIGISSFLVIKNIPFNQPQTTTNTPFQASSSAQTKNSPTSTISPTKSKSQTSTPTPTSTKAPTFSVQKNTCGVEVVYGKMGGISSDPLLVTLVASFTSHNNAYLTGAKWDFEGNGSWDTDLKQSNGQMEHTYPQAGTYTAKLQVQGSDGTYTDICSKSLTVPSGTTVRLTGKVYEDINCNGVPEPSEKGVANATVTIDNTQTSASTTVNTDSNGNYSFSQNVQSNSYVSLSPGFSPVPPGYKSNPYFTEPTLALNSNQSSVNVDLPLIPNENVGACQR